MRDRVIGGGSYYNDSWVMRTTLRLRNYPEYPDRYKGFRIVVRKRSP